MKQIQFYHRFDDSNVNFDEILNWYKGEKSSLENSNAELYDIALDENNSIKILGQGSNAHAFLIKGKAGAEFDNCVIKVFYPITREKTAFDGTIMQSSILDDKYRLKSINTSIEDFTERLQRFINSYDKGIEINNAYADTGRTKVLSSELYFTSHGICYVSKALGGELLSDYVKKDLKLADYLDIASKMLNDIAVYNEKNTIHADVKPDNFWCVNLDTNLSKESRFIPAITRSLDFGSICNIDSLIKNIKGEFSIKTPEDVDSVIEYIKDIEDLNLLFFESTGKYYSQKTQNEIVKMIVFDYIDGKMTNDIIQILLALDIVAVLKLLYYQLLGDSDSTIWKEHYEKNKTRLFTELVGDKASFKAYHIASILKKLFDTCSIIDSITYKTNLASVAIFNLDEVKSCVNDLFEMVTNPNTYVRNHCNLEEYDDLLCDDDTPLTMREMVKKYGIERLPADLITDILIE